MKLFLFLRTIPIAVNLTFTVSFVALCIKILWLNAVPAPMEWMVNFGVIAEGILASIIASYIFYLFVVHYPEHQKCKVLLPIVAPLCQRIGNYSYHILNHIHREAGCPEHTTVHPAEINLEQLEFELRLIAAKCYEHSESSQKSTQNFFDYVIGDINKVNEDIQEVLNHVNNLAIDSKLIKSLLTLRSSRLGGTMTGINKHGKYRGLDDKALVELFNDYNNECLKVYTLGKKLESIYGVSTRI